MFGGFKQLRSSGSKVRPKPRAVVVPCIASGWTKHMVFQPVEQLPSRAADHPKLRKVDMRVDKTGEKRSRLEGRGRLHQASQRESPRSRRGQRCVPVR
jgi:hypothetical protein